MANITVIGGGAWGTALAVTSAIAGNKVCLWAYEEETVQEINTEHRSSFLPSAQIPETVVATTDMQQALSNPDFVLFVSPAQFNRGVYKNMHAFIKDETPLVICAKGIELSTGLLLSEVIKEENENQNIAVLSGPGFATELARFCPTAVTIAARDDALAQYLCQTLKTEYFRPYSSTDIITPQVCGSVKNVLAIASGISEGCSLGDNAKAAMITRGLAEMSRFAVAVGGKRESVLGLCGIGDLLLTANSHQSRNFSCGFEIGQCGWAKPVLARSTKTVEGVATAQSVMKRARALGVEMPICQTVEDILYNEKPIKQALMELLSRPLKAE